MAARLCHSPGQALCRDRSAWDRSIGGGRAIAVLRFLVWAAVSTSALSITWCCGGQVPPCGGPGGGLGPARRNAQPLPVLPWPCSKRSDTRTLTALAIDGHNIIHRLETDAGPPPGVSLKPCRTLTSD